MAFPRSWAYKTALTQTLTQTTSGADGGIGAEMFGKQLTDCEKRRKVVEQQGFTIEGVYQSLHMLDMTFDKLDREDQRNVLESLISKQGLSRFWVMV